MLYLRRFLPLLIVMVAACAFVGCAEKEPPPPAEPPPPPPPTPEEIAAKIVTESGLGDPLPEAGAAFTQEASDKLKNRLRSARNQNKDTPDGQRALQLVNQQLDQRIRALEGAGAWEFVLGHIEGFEILNQGSPKWQSTKDQALAELAKPRITIVGFMQDTAILRFYLPVTRQEMRESMRAGEEMHGVTLMEIIGNNQGVRMKYGQTGQTFDVLTKSAQN